LAFCLSPVLAVYGQQHGDWVDETLTRRRKLFWGASCAWGEQLALASDFRHQRGEEKHRHLRAGAQVAAHAERQGYRGQ
jgi:hypothetical protein